MTRIVEMQALFDQKDGPNQDVKLKSSVIVNQEFKQTQCGR
jgi:hypothetical protein